MAAGRMTRAPLSRPQAARAKAAERQRAMAAAKKAERAKQRYGPLRDRVVRPATLKRYRRHMKEFFDWCRKTGLKVPSTVEDFDEQLCQWAECLWAEGDARAILGNALCGFSHSVGALRGKLNGVWRLYQAWGRSEKVSQAPPLTASMMRGVAGWFAKEGLTATATGILLAHNCILRIQELTDLRPGDVTFARNVAVIVLRDTKIGARTGVHQEVPCKDPWLLERLRRACKDARPGAPLIGITAYEFRKLWRRACAALSIPKRYTPYSLRRGGATSLFVWCGKYDKVCEKGRWQSTRAMRAYLNQALLDLASDGELDAWHELHNRFAQHLHQMP